MKNQTVLSARDAETLLDLIDNPPQPNQALRQAAKRFHEEVVETS